MDNHKIICDEKDISTIQQEKEEQARLQSTDANQERTKSALPQKGKRQEKTVRFRRYSQKVRVYSS